MTKQRTAQTFSICVGSTNPVKVQAAREAFTLMFPLATVTCKGIKALSGVSDQPMSEAETRLGAQNRVRYCSQITELSKSDFYVAMEGGVDQFEEGPATFAYVAILDRNDRLLTGRSASLPLPESVFQRLCKKEELGLVMDDLFKTNNVKQKGGAIGLLTNHVATRQSIYTQALVLALAPVLHPEHYIL